MFFIGNFNFWIFLLIIEQASAISYNQPKFCSNASWNPNATTFATNVTIGLKPYKVFVDRNNTVYVTNPQYNQVVIWSEGNPTPSRIISSNVLAPRGLFVTTLGDIYVDSDNLTGRVDKWTLNSTFGIPTMYTCQKCYDLFIDISNTLYCSMSSLHQIVAMSLNSNSSIWLNLAGTGAAGNTSFSLSSPYGIFVNINFDLYVADSGNNRIQLFRSGELNGTTVAGNTSLNITITLNYPTGIILDADNNLYIVDSGNNRIVGPGPYGSRCLFGCSGSSGSASNQLNSPQFLSFDTYGNMFVADWGNNRIQKFSLTTNSCMEYLLNTTDSLRMSSQTNVSSSNIVSYNRPKFCPGTTWNPNGTTFATNDTIGTSPYDIFIDTNNTIYILDRTSGEIVIWFNNSTNLTRRISGNYSQARGIFVSISGEIYVDNGNLTGRVEKYSLKTNSSVPVMYVGQQCFGLFIDANNILYCSITGLHQVATKSLNSNSTTLKIVAGTQCPGSMSNQLNSPYGIFVNTNFDLYVADYGNDRIQFFRSGELNGTTVAGNTSLNITITLNYPAAITLDLDNNLFIVDKGNNRIIISEANGFRCILGCNGTGLTPYQMNGPQMLSFDTHGNMFITDWVNNRVQKFLIVTNSCDELTTQQSILTSTMEKALSSVTPSIISSSVFLPPSCTNQNQIGLDCNISSTPCDIMRPCQNNGSCISTNSIPSGYICTCPTGFSGDKCQTDNRPCEADTCWNNGICNETSGTTFECLCQSGWTNIHCETKVNYCENVTCLNNGVCRPLFLNYTCECLGISYSGRYCEIVEQTTAVRQVISKSFGYIAIIFLVVVISFFIIMDILKYCFGIDPAKNELKKIRKAKAMKRVKHPPVIQRFIYVNAP